MTSESEHVRRWLDSGARAVARERERLDAINVFPVADSDTGTNLYLTLMEGNRAVARLPREATHREVVAAFARGSLVGARGNSGVIVSQYLTAFLAAVDERGGLGSATASGVVDALDRAADAAWEAVGDPVDGTILSVARAAADGARGACDAGAGLEAVSIAAVVSARAELARTGDVLAQAREAGVVDAGAAGLVLQLEMLAETLAGEGALEALDEVEWERNAREDGRTPAQSALAHLVDDPRGRAGAFEVMFLAHRPDVPGDEGEPRPLKAALASLGGSVAVTGGGGLWQAHVHTDQPDAALDAAMRADATQVVVRHIPTARVRAHGTTGVVALTACPGLAAPLASSGAAVLVVPDPSGVVESELARVVADAAADVVYIVAGAPALLAAAHALDARVEDVEVRVVAAATEPEVIAALTAASMIEPSMDPGAAMAAAVGRTTSGRSAIDTIADDVERMVGGDAAVATIILGRGVSPSVAATAVSRLGADTPHVEVHVFAGGQAAPPVILGVERDPA